MGAYAFFALVIIFTTFPFLNLLALSFSDPGEIESTSFRLFPSKFSLISYTTIFTKNDKLAQALFNSVSRTILGTVTNVFVSSGIAYALSRRDFILRRFMSRYVFFTMYITAGIIPVYLLYSKLGLINNYAVYIVPHLVSAYNIIIIRTFMEGLPESLTEAAHMDGASDPQLFFKIIIPLCLPVIATVALFIAVFQWSSWQDTFLYASNPKAGLTTLQFEMTKIIRQSNTTYTDAQLRDLASFGGSLATSESLQAAMIMLATVPILMIYPFLQKYFVNGVTLGAIKE
jgi:putative aldouronate transport system permease protein